MGRRPLDKYFSLTRLSIKNQVIVGVIIIAVFSFIGTITTYFVLMKFLGGQSQYADSSIPALESYIQKHGIHILSKDWRPQLDSRLANAFTMYQVMNTTGVPLYGPYAKRLFYSAQAVLSHVNIRQMGHAYILDAGANSSMLIPIANNQGLLAGAMYVAWKTPISSLYGFPSLVIYGFFATLIITPFFFIGLFTYLFARRLSKNINQPVQTLIRAARKIQMRDLDFQIEDYGNHEIGQLLLAFEEMRSDLKDALTRQWALEDERREMLQAISHDVRTPLTIIQGHAEMLEEMCNVPDVIHRYAGIINRNANRIVRLLADLKTITDLENPQFTLTPTRVAIVEFFQEKLSDYDALAKSQGKTMKQHITCTTEESLEVLIDVDRLAQIMDNIMANALRYTPQDSFFTWNIEVRKDSTSLSLRDTGPGFNPQDIDKVSRKFHRSETSRTDAAFHAGLGLYIVKELAERFHGSLSLSNHRHGGAVVEVSVRYFTY